MDSSISHVQITASVSNNLSILGSSKITIPFTKPAEKDGAFLLSVGNRIGADTITVTATGKNETADYSVHLPITSPNPLYTEVIDTMVTKNKPVTLTARKFGLPGTNQATLAFTRIPDIQLDKRYSYLITYPYGCIEQTVSAAFPQLYLFNLVDLKQHQKQAVTDDINATIKKLLKFQLSMGFSFWPNSTYHRPEYSDWGSTYTGHFLVAAKALGYHVPNALYQHWLQEAQDGALRVNRENHRYQTYRLFVLALAGKAHLGAMNLVRENHLSELDPLSKKFLAAAYFINGNKQAARAIDRSISADIPQYREMSGTYGSTLRDQAFMTYLCLKMEDLQNASLLLKRLVKDFSSPRWYSTQETAIALLSLGTYYDISPFTAGAIKFSVKMGDQKEQSHTLTGYQSVLNLADIWDKPITIGSDTDNPLFVNLFVKGVPIESRVSTKNKGIQLTRNMYSEEGQSLALTYQKQGQPIWVIYTIQSMYNVDLEEIVLSSIFPAGWEIINTRLTGEEPPNWVREMGLQSGEYMDIRDDRVNWFFDLMGGKKIYLGVKINPTFKGSYSLPPVIAEAMYAPEYYAHIEGGRVEVR
jgi:uncharacterized protein YfaS (alpha-2-macroglobulin family)